MLYPLSRIWNPAVYQGGARTRRYFEGWYLKLVDADGQHPLALIPGVSFSADGSTRQAFVQLVRPGGTGRYFAYPADAFTFTKDRFRIAVGDSRFAEDGLDVDLRDEHGGVSGSVRFGPWSPWPVRPLSPGVMGWYRFVPGMECYHGVLSMDHSLSGTLVVDGEVLSFDGGRGYVEKDWGASFPSSWIWAQSNRFARPGVSVSASIARVPWMNASFTGSIAGLLLDGELHRFTTYTGAKLACLKTRPGEADVVLRDARAELELHIQGAAVSALRAPTLGSMEARADEALDANIHVTLRTIRGGRATTVFDAEGRSAGVEIMDERGELEPAPRP
ncbi:MAG: tocopherol cyclase family protein [Coriobacteriia bacterium]|nr:tocopherol cyclase family protein [Coriobacteriia bacterium]